MSKGRGGFIGQNGLNAPDSPTNVSASAGSSEATISFTAPSDVGGSAITGFRVQSNTGAGASGSSSPITVTGLSNGTSYTFNVWAINAFGYSAPSDVSGSVSPAEPRAFWFGRTTVNVFYSTITSTGNTTDWGYAMRYAAYNTGTASSATRAVQCGYSAASSDVQSRLIEQLNLASAGAGTNFGDLNVTGAQNNAGLGNGIRGVFTQGYTSDGSYGKSNVIEYVTIASAGNSSDFGDLTTGRIVNSALASPTRGVVVAGFYDGGNFSNTMDYVTIASAGNATDFGDTLYGINGTASCSSSTRGIIAGGDRSGASQINIIQYITIASAGNATDFGDLTHGLRYGGAGGSEIRALIAGEFSGNSNGINYVTIASTGNASDFGDLTNNETNGVSCASNSHGGLQ